MVLVGELLYSVRKNSLMNKGLRGAPVAPVRSHQSSVRSEEGRDKWTGRQSYGAVIITGRGFRAEKYGPLIRFICFYT